jgi:hypothetical protein
MKKHTLLRAGVAAHNPHQYNVVIGTDMGQFSGTVVCREEDYDHESKFLGYELAEIKAEIAYARAQRDYWNARLKALTQFWREMADTRNYNVDAYWVKKMRKEVDEADKRVAYWVETINYLKEAYHIKIQVFDASVQSRKVWEQKNGRD